MNDIRRDISGPVISVIFNTQDSVTSRCRAGEAIHFIASCRCRGQKAITEPDFYTVVCENKELWIPKSCDYFIIWTFPWLLAGFSISLTFQWSFDRRTKITLLFDRFKSPVSQIMWSWKVRSIRAQGSVDVVLPNSVDAPLPPPIDRQVLRVLHALELDMSQKLCSSLQCWCSKLHKQEAGHDSKRYVPPPVWCNYLLALLLCPPHQVLRAPPHGPGHVSQAVFLPAVLMLEAPQAGCWAWLKRCVLPRLVLMQLNPGQTLNTESTPRGAGHVSSLVIRDHCLLWLTHLKGNFKIFIFETPLKRKRISFY